MECNLTYWVASCNELQLVIYLLPVSSTSAPSKKVTRSCIPLTMSFCSQTNVVSIAVAG